MTLRLCTCSCTHRDGLRPCLFVPYLIRTFEDLSLGVNIDVRDAKQASTDSIANSQFICCFTCGKLYSQENAKGKPRALQYIPRLSQPIHFPFQFLFETHEYECPHLSPFTFQVTSPLTSPSPVHRHYNIDFHPPLYLTASVTASLSVATAKAVCQ